MFSRWLTAVLVFSPLAIHAQQEGPVPTQFIVTVDAKTSPKITASDVTAKVNRREMPIKSLSPIAPGGTQVALLIDDGLRTSVGRQLPDIRNFITSLPAGVEVLVGYMQSGRVVPVQPFTTDHAQAAANVRLPMGVPGQSASPYFCLSDFVKNWPGGANEDVPSTPKARFVMMLTNGVDPYNGSVSPMNQNSPYVQAAIADAQKAGVSVYSIYYGDSGFRGSAASFSGQNYLQQVSQSTGGRAYFQGTGSPVSLSPFLAQFRNSIAESYIANLDAAGTKLVDLNLSTKLSGTKLRAPEMIRPGTRLAAD